MTDPTSACGPVPDGGRRRLLRGLAAAGVAVAAGLAGCSANFQTTRGPDPDVVREQVDPPLSAVTFRQMVTVTALVANLGDPGEVEIIAEARALGEAEPLDTTSVTVEMDSDDQREIAFQMSVSPAAEFVEARAEPV